MIWEKPNGSKIEINDKEVTIEHAESLGWVQMGENPKTENPKTSPSLPDLKPDSFESNPATSGAITQEEQNE